MARATGTEAAARRRRIKHEQRINAEPNPLARAGLIWSWLFAELRRVPHLLNSTIERLHQIAADLNDYEANPQKGADQ